MSVIILHICTVFETILREDKAGKVVRAASAKRMLTVHQKTSTTTLIRVVEPYAFYPTSDGTLILECWFVAGDYVHTAPPH